jgi:hypothetical protein
MVLRPPGGIKGACSGGPGLCPKCLVIEGGITHGMLAMDACAVGQVHP